MKANEYLDKEGMAGHLSEIIRELVKDVEALDIRVKALERSKLTIIKGR